MTIRHATLAHNTGGAGFSPGTPTASVYNSIIWGNTVAAFGALADAACNIDQGGTAGPANNPRFLAPADGVFWPGLGSPAINACTTGLANDLVGTARPIGTFYDLGAYEVLPPLTLPIILR